MDTKYFMGYYYVSVAKNLVEKSKQAATKALGHLQIHKNMIKKTSSNTKLSPSLALEIISFMIM